MRKLMQLAVRYEAGVWRSLYHWIARHPTSPAGEQPFGYTAAVAPVMWGFTAVSAIEIPVLHLLIPWGPVRGVGLVFGLWGLLWMTGITVALKIHPHTLGPQGIRVRNSFATSVFIPWSNVERVRFKHRNYEKGRTIQPDGDMLSLVVMSQTNVDIVLREPMTVRKVLGHTPPFTELRIFADDKTGFTTRARELQPCRHSGQP